MSRIYLVDTENVASTWQTILPELAADDLLLIFYTKNSPGIAYTDLGTLMQYIGRFSCVECYAGANGLDFQLVSYLGYLLADHPDAEFIIVSRDTGYDAVCKFWTDKGKSVVRRTHIVPGETPTEDAPDVAKPADDLRDRIARLLSGVASSEEIDRVADLFEQGDVDQGQMHNALVLSFGAVRGLELYNMLRPVFRSSSSGGKTAARRSARVVRRTAVKETPKPEPVKETPKPEPTPVPAAEPASKSAKKSPRARRKPADKSLAKPEKADKPEKQPDPQPTETPAAPIVDTAASEQPAKKPRRRAPRRKPKEAADKAE